MATIGVSIHKWVYGTQPRPGEELIIYRVAIGALLVLFINSFIGNVIDWAASEPRDRVLIDALFIAVFAFLLLLYNNKQSQPEYSNNDNLLHIPQPIVQASAKPYQIPPGLMKQLESKQTSPGYRSSRV